MFYKFTQVNALTKEAAEKVVSTMNWGKSFI